VKRGMKEMTTRKERRMTREYDETCDEKNRRMLRKIRRKGKGIKTKKERKRSIRCKTRDCDADN
jgi:hypothetical protein